MMGTFDYPLEQLKTYQGLSPIPKDFDAFWEKSLGRIKPEHLNFKLDPVSIKLPKVSCHDMSFTALDQSIIHVKCLKPKDAKKPTPGMILFHGKNMTAGDWADKLIYTSLGFTVFALECRGQGGKSENLFISNVHSSYDTLIHGIAAEQFYYHALYLDVVQLARIILSLPEVNYTQVCVNGASQGGGLAIVCGALEPRIRKIISIYPYPSDFKRVWELGLAERAYQAITDYLRIIDPLHETEEAFFEKLDYIDVKNFAHLVKGETLMALTLNDTLCPPSTQFAVYNRLPNKKKALIYHDYGHEWLPKLIDKMVLFLEDWISFD